MYSLTMKDAMVDPHQTMTHPRDPGPKDPGYVELNKRSAEAQGKVNRVTYDY